MQAHDSEKTTDQADLSSSLASLDDLPSPTFGHYLTTINRVHAEDLEYHGRLTPHRFTPLFVTGVLELPGTLGYVLGYSSGLDIAKYMKPGICLDDGAGRRVQGTVVFGRGQDNRDALDEWYGEGYVFAEVQVVIGLADGVARKLKAYRWVKEGGEEQSHGELDDGIETGGWKDLMLRGESRSRKGSGQESLAAKTMSGNETGWTSSGGGRRDDIGD